jgi:RNA recognition motif-containing protein
MVERRREHKASERLGGSGGGFLGGVGDWKGKGIMSNCSNDKDASVARLERDLISFYSSYFPNSTRSSFLWYVFHKWGNVTGVFIPTKRSKRGKKFGFVRFRNVADVTALENGLNNLRDGSMCLHVNLSFQSY